jgi:hypothetical protein
MANTTTETLTVNGVVLNTLAKNIESLTGRLRTPGRRTTNVTVAARHGALRVANKLFAENVLALPMWVIGGDDNGRVPSGQTDRRLLRSNIDTLTRLFLGSTGPLDIRWTRPDGTVRQCFGDVLDAIDFTTETPDQLAKFGVTITMTDPFWYDLTNITQQLQANGANATFSSFAGATAPMERLRAKLIGPWNSPIVTFADGSWFAVDVNIPAAATVTINSDTWTLSSTGVTTILSNLRRSAGVTGRWLTIPPTVDGPVVSFSGSGRTTATQLELFGKRAYLVG